MGDVVLSVADFRKAYGANVAVDGISFTVERGEIFGLLGPNGAGKTTTLECLEGLRRPDGGVLRILGIDPARDGRALHRAIGVQLQSAALPAAITVGEAMRFFCAYHGVPPRDDLLERMGLGEKRAAQYRDLSTGQARRLALALAVAHRPPVIFLDEPTAGLDVGSRAELHAMLAEFRQDGTTIVLATHDMAEAEKLADRVAILLRGKIAAEGSPRELTATGAGLTRVSVQSEQAVLAHDGVRFPGVSRQGAQDEYAVYFSDDPGATVAAILAYLTAQHDHLIDLRVERPSLEDRFLEITTAGGPA